MENKHTPGPWYAESGHEQRNGQLYWQVTDGNDAIMQNQFCWCQGSQEANARLIAAAPDLLEALEMMRDNETIRAVCPSPIWATITAAIAKARGQ